MVIWHNTGDASRIPENVTAGEEVVLWIGTYPIEPGQTVWVDMRLTKSAGRTLSATQPAEWHSNNEQRNNSYWIAQIGAFDQGDHVEYSVLGSCHEEQARCADLFEFDVS